MSNCFALRTFRGSEGACAASPRSYWLLPRP